ncbi:hypothetical protein B0I35DRAFT_38629 [Stachybotrys elegans]|uniref:Uncharacterized protein n=1 Tax=Stachybotrys elegans TaxID=80388 RepID=A0A8K0T8B7_9HYPO|nr:hypothetical protein B0I35DRAFT_38629 [Stachybotrys elegans]
MHSPQRRLLPASDTIEAHTTGHGSKQRPSAVHGLIGAYLGLPRHKDGCRTCGRASPTGSADHLPSLAVPPPQKEPDHPIHLSVHGCARYGRAQVASCGL